MRRTEIIEAIGEIKIALIGSGLDENLKRRLPSKEGDEWQVKIVTALKAYTIAASNYSPAAKQLAKILGIEILEDPVLWAILISKDDARGRHAHSMIIENVLFATKHLPRIAELIRPASSSFDGDAEEKKDPKFQDKDIITIIIIEEDNKLSSPERLIGVLESVSKLYEGCALMLGVPPEGFSVLSCDSGSDKSFDFLGAAKVIECLKEFILSMWDRVVFYRERKLEERIELVNKSLPVYDRIADLVKEKKLEPEMGEILRRNIFEGTSKFIKAGVTIPEMERVSLQPPRALLSPEPKLLVSAPTDTPGTEEGVARTAGASTTESEGARAEIPNSTSKALSDEEQELLASLLRKIQKGDKTNTPEDREADDEIEDEL